MVESFFDFFPAPKFLEMPSPGFSISDSGIHYIEFSEGKHGSILKGFGHVAIPDGSIVSGKIEHADVLIPLLQDFRKEKNIQYIRTTLPDERVYLYTTDIPKVSSKEMRTVVESTLEENVPLSVSDVVFDYNILKTQEVNQKEDVVRVSVSVIPREVVEEYLSLFQSAGFSPLHFEIESQAVAKAVVPRDDMRAFLVINMSSTKAALSIVYNGQVLFTSTVSVTSDLQAVLSEIKKITVYFQTQADRRGEVAPAFEKIYMSGSEAIRPEIIRILHTEAKIPIEIANVWTNMLSLREYIPDINREESLLYASAIGVAIKNHTS